jgi:hypothetical protein
LGSFFTNSSGHPGLSKKGNYFDFFAAILESVREGEERVSASEGGRESVSERERERERVRVRKRCRSLRHHGETVLADGQS